MSSSETFSHPDPFNQSLREQQMQLEQVQAALGTIGGMVSGFYYDFGSVVSGDLVIPVAVVGESFLVDAFAMIWQPNWPGPETGGSLRMQLYRMGMFTGDGPDWEPISKMETILGSPNRPMAFRILQSEVGSGSLLACRISASPSATNTRFWRDSTVFTLTAHFQAQP